MCVITFVCVYVHLIFKESPYLEVVDSLQSRLGSVTCPIKEDLAVTYQGNSFHSYIMGAVFYFGYLRKWYFVSDIYNYDKFKSRSQITTKTLFLYSVDLGSRSPSLLYALVYMYL